MTTAIFLVAHGSYDPGSAIALQEMYQGLGDRLTALAYLATPSHLGMGQLDCAPIPLEEQLNQFIQGLGTQVGRVVVVPLFLLPGIHVMEDIPQAIARAQNGCSIPLERLPFLGSWPPFRQLIQAHFNPSGHWIVIAHGSRRPQAQEWLQTLAQTCGAKLAVWSQENSLEAAIQGTIAEAGELPCAIDIFPYFLFAGKTVAAIAQQVRELQLQYPQVKLHLHSSVEVTSPLLDCVAHHIIDSIEALDSPVRVLLCGYYGYGNGGDEALLASLLQMLPASVRPIVLTSNPAATAALHGVDTCDRRDWRKLLKLLGQCDGFIWGGGSLIQDVTSWRSPLYYLGLMVLAQGAGAITLAWGQGIGPLRSPLNQRLTKHLLKNCTAVSVRDGASAELLTRWRIPHTQGADPVWALDGSPVSLENLPSPRIALSLRSHRTLTPERLGVLCHALDQFQQITQAFILLLPFQKSQDLAIAEEIHAFLGDRRATQGEFPNKTSQTSEILILENPRALKGVFATIHFAIAMRLHALIMAAAEGCPCFALSYDPKVTSLMTELNLPGVEMTELPMDPNHLAQQWTRAYSQGAIAPNQRQTLKTSALIHQQLLKKLTTKKGA